MSIEQINNSTETAQYLHHDQAGSTRLITSESGGVLGAYTYSPYGTPAGSTSPSPPSDVVLVALLISAISSHEAHPTRAIDHAKYTNFRTDPVEGRGPADVVHSALEEYLAAHRDALAESFSQAQRAIASGDIAGLAAIASEASRTPRRDRDIR